MTRKRFLEEDILGILRPIEKANFLANDILVTL
jgi:hypothetical protein